MERKYLTITALNRYLKYKFDHDINLQKVLLKAEISNFKRHSRGHLYLTLKDDSSQCKAIMFSSHTNTLNFSPKDGDKVIVEGHISIYEAYGNYQLYIKKMDLDGIGDLYLAYEKLKEELEQSGMFKPEFKQSLPKYPRTIGVITSPTGAAVKDIMNVIGLRYPLAKIIVYPALVQGINSKTSIVKQIEQANQDKLVDLLIVGRGGGSIEDLWAFNEKIVAKAIFDSKLPIISAVGHETDFTIADFVADLRASTPSHAAEIAVPNKTDIFELIDSSTERIRMALDNKYQNNLENFNQLVRTNTFKNPEKILENTKMKLIYLEDKLNAYQPKNQIKHFKEIIMNYQKRMDLKITNTYDLLSKDFLNLAEKLELVNPLQIMKKGYTVTKQGKQIIKSVEEVNQDLPMQVDFHDGNIICNIIEVKK